MQYSTAGVGGGGLESHLERTAQMNRTTPGDEMVGSWSMT